MVILAFLLGILPGFVWLMFYLQEDVHPEPKKMIAKVFIAGAAITAVILLFEFLFQELARFIVIPQYEFVSIAVFAAIEEIFKFLAAYLAIRKSGFFDEPIDAMIYMIVAALGLATVENILIASNMLLQSGLGDGVLIEAIKTITLRFVGATLLHVLSSGIIGYYWAEGILHNRTVFLIIWGLIVGIALHTVFNYLILIFNKEVLIYPTIFLAIAAFFLFYDFEKIKRPLLVR